MVDGIATQLRLRFAGRRRDAGISPCSKHQTENAMRFGGVRIKDERFFGQVDGFAGLVLARVECGHLRFDLCGFWIRRLGPLERGECAIVITFVLEVTGEHEFEVRRVGIGGNRGLRLAQRRHAQNQQHNKS
jgi:hypothetical protein